MRILITGASGFIGRVCIEGFSANGWQVRAISRQRLIAPGKNVEVVAIRSFADADWPYLLSGVDCVLHLAGIAHQATAKEQDYWNINVHVTAQIVNEAVTARVNRFIYLSSVAVHGRSPTSLLNEHSQVMPDDWNGETKAIAEQKLQQIARGTDLSWTIVRPPLVYGFDAPGNFRRLVKLLQLGLPLPLSGANAPRSYISADNLVSALICIASSNAARNRTYLVSDNDDVSSADLIRLIAKSLGKACYLWWLPPSLLRFGAAVIGRSLDAERLLGRLQIDSSAIRQELNWIPPFSTAESINRSLR